MEEQMRQKAQSLMRQMTVDEKISQLMNDAPGIERLGIRPYNWWNEALHGVARNGRATVFPEPIGLGASFDTALLEQMGDAVATEGRAKFNEAQRLGNYGLCAGLTYWSPNVNIFRDPRWGRGMETYGEDPFLTGKMGTAYVKGLQGTDPFFLKAAACAKHYAVHSGPEKDRHSFNATPTRRDLFETYLPAFRRLVQEGRVEAVMGAYNRVYGESASGSPYLLTDILRTSWGFKGHVVSDCGAVADIYTGHRIAGSYAEAAAIALKSGLNLNCGTSFRALKEALDRKLIEEKDLDRALLPLLLTRLKLGILTADDRSPYADVPLTVVACEAHAELARRAAQESMVLLKNEGALPLDKHIRTLYVAGPYATDLFALMGNYYGVSNRYVSFLQGIVEKASVGTCVYYKQGFQATTPNVNEVDWSVGEAKTAEVCVVVMGHSGATEGEEGDAIASPLRGDKADIALPAHQMDFLRRLRHGNTNKIVTVLTGGGPIDVREVAALSDAVVMAWYAGQEGGRALGDLLFGDVGFSGRLPVTFPSSADVLPAFDDYSMCGRTYKYMKDNIQYPFGYGLTYGSVAYKSVKILNPKRVGKEPVAVEVILQNDGQQTVEEVAQLYLSVPGAGRTAPTSSLVGFERVTLQPGAEKRVRFTVEPDLVKTVQENGESKLLKGTYTFTAGAAAPCERSEELGVKCCRITLTL